MSNVVDSSGWIEYFVGSKNGKSFAEAINDIENLTVPSVVIFEVFKKFYIERDETMALKVTSHMKLGKVVEFNDNTAILAAKIGHDMGLRAIDSIIYATAWLDGAILWTQDADFKKVAGVKYFAKR